MVILDSCQTVLTISGSMELVVRQIFTNMAWCLLDLHCVRIMKILADLALRNVSSERFSSIFVVFFVMIFS